MKKNETHLSVMRISLPQQSHQAVPASRERRSDRPSRRDIIRPNSSTPPRLGTLPHPRIAMTNEKGLFERVGDGAIPGTFVGFSLGAARAYLESRTIADKSVAAIASAKSAKVPPTAAALHALRPKVSLDELFHQ